MTRQKCIIVLQDVKEEKLVKDLVFITQGFRNEQLSLIESLEIRGIKLPNTRLHSSKNINKLNNVDNKIDIVLEARRECLINDSLAALIICRLTEGNTDRIMNNPNINKYLAKALEVYKKVACNE